MTYQLRPSGSAIWTKCARQPRIASNVKSAPQDSDAAREGTCAAWVAEQAIRTTTPVADYLGATHENGWVVDNEMVYHVENYVTLVKSRAPVVNAEVRVKFNDYISGTFDSSATDGTTLYLDDLKYGYKLVDVYENTQTIIYAYGELIRLNDPAITHVVLGIYQPRAWHPEGPHRTWKLTVAELYEQARKIDAASVACQSPGAVATPGSHCEYCPGRGECEALATTLYDWYTVAERRGQGAMSADELSHELTFLERLKDLYDARKTAVHAEAELRLSGGEYVPGWSLKDRFGNRRFTVDETTVELMTGVSPVKTATMTPAELERAGADKKVVKGLTESPRIGKKLERVTGKDFGRMFRERG